MCCVDGMQQAYHCSATMSLYNYSGESVALGEPLLTAGVVFLSQPRREAAVDHLRVRHTRQCHDECMHVMLFWEYVAIFLIF